MDRFLALDMGAESGRGVVGTIDAAHETVSLEETHRFPTGAVRLGDRLHWDLPRIAQEMGVIIGKATEEGTLAGIGVDTWGVDYGLLDSRGNLVGLPLHYRDKRNEGMIDAVYNRIARAAVYERTGTQTISINTLFQLAAAAQETPRLLDAADTLLMMPDLLHFYLTGVAQSEFTIASTTQLYDAAKHEWATEIADAIGFPSRLFPNVVKDGTRYGELLPVYGAGNVPVIAPGGHDTACAVAAVPAEGSGWAFLSSGTWSLLGVETAAPVRTPAALQANMTNEGGVCGTNRLLKNIAGLWLVQECRRAYARLGSERSYDQLTRLAGEARPLAAFVDPDYAAFTAPDDMPKAIRERCIETNQTPPEGIGATVRCCLDSLGLKYRHTLAQLEYLTGETIHTLHIVGGGSQNRLLNQIAADATGRRVLSGPVEATALGSVLLQARSAGLLGTLSDVRRFVRNSVRPEVYEPERSETARFDAVYETFVAGMTGA
ncbi:MAG: rhamnulokinase [Armatimonadetes bacterium]|nr:rhamnulokinase [Armatimonadota bacterium]